MQEGSELLKSRGYRNITGIIPVNGFHDIKKVLDETTKYTFDVALVSAGVSANILCAELAKNNKIAIDFGQMIDRLLIGGLSL
jgi:hypothetical protein